MPSGRTGPQGLPQAAHPSQMRTPPSWICQHISSKAMCAPSAECEIGSQPSGTDPPNWNASWATR